MIKASSLLYAIFVCIIVALLCGTMVMLFSYHHQFKQQLFSVERLLTTNNNDFNFIRNMLNDGIMMYQDSLVNDDEITTVYSISKWGFYPLIKLKTYKEKDTLKKVLLLGTRNDSHLALYLTNTKKPLYIGGNTKIKGHVKVSNYGVKPAYIDDLYYTGSEQIVDGNIEVSQEELPQLSEFFNIIHQGEYNTYTLDHLKTTNNQLYNDFFNRTIKINVTQNNIKDIAISGNFILESKDSIFINKSSILKDIIIKAPKVVFEKGFKGNLQIIANSLVHLEKNVELQYPSTIYINSSTPQQAKIILEENGIVAGSIILTGNRTQNNKDRTITINDHTIVIGTIYCNGSTTLKGAIYGCLYTNIFHQSTEDYIYENYIINGEINREALPEIFAGTPLFNQTYRYEIIKEL